jgi:hypothetical protein
MKLQFLTAGTLQMHKYLFCTNFVFRFVGVILYPRNGRFVLQFVHEYIHLEHTVTK